MNREGRSPLEVGVDSSERNETNSDYTLEIEAKQQEVEQQFEEVLEEIEASEVPEETKQRLIEKLVKTSKKVSMSLALIGSMGFAGYGVGIGASVATKVPIDQLSSIAREQLITDVSTRDVKGKKVYSHSDETTTHLLNAVAGKEKLRLEEYEGFIRADLKKVLTTRMERVRGTGFEKPLLPLFQKDYTRIDSMDIEELGTVYRMYTGFGSSDIDKMSGREYLEYCLDPNPNTHLNDQEVLNEELYQALWQLEAECGEPKIRLVLDPKDTNLHSSRDSYDQKTNTIFIVWPYKDSIRRGESGLIAELSHSKQFSDKPLQSRYQQWLDADLVRKEMKRTGLNWDTAYDKLLYSLPGSIEHEAHSEIEPKIHEQLESLLPQRAIFFAKSMVSDEQSTLDLQIKFSLKEKQETLTNNMQAFRRKMEALIKVFEKDYQEASDQNSKTTIIGKFKGDVMSLLEEYKQNKFKITKDPGDLASG